MDIPSFVERLELSIGRTPDVDDAVAARTRAVEGLGQRSPEATCMALDTLFTILLIHMCKAEDALKLPSKKEVLAFCDNMTGWERVKAAEVLQIKLQMKSAQRRMTL
jgi:hypothetical protein